MRAIKARKPVLANGLCQVAVANAVVDLPIDTSWHQPAQQGVNAPAIGSCDQPGSVPARSGSAIFARRLAPENFGYQPGQFCFAGARRAGQDYMAGQQSFVDAPDCVLAHQHVPAHFRDALGQLLIREAAQRQMINRLPALLPLAKDLFLFPDLILDKPAQEKFRFVGANGGAIESGQCANQPTQSLADRSITHLRFYDDGFIYVAQPAHMLHQAQIKQYAQPTQNFSIIDGGFVARRIEPACYKRKEKSAIFRIDVVLLQALAGRDALFHPPQKAGQILNARSQVLRAKIAQEIS